MALNFPSLSDSDIQESWIKCMGPKLWRFDIYNDNFDLWRSIIENFTWNEFINIYGNISHVEYSLLEQDYKKRTIGSKNLNRAFLIINDHMKNGNSNYFKQSELDLIQTYLEKDKFTLNLFYYALGKPILPIFEFTNVDINES